MTVCKPELHLTFGIYIVYGFSVQVSGAMKMQRTEHRKQMTEDKGQTVFCNLTAAARGKDLTPEIRHLTPKIRRINVEIWCFSFEKPD
jgi:hypothetical protein